MQSDEQRRMLGRFLRAHRERTTPDAPGRRRRTPGLRREELAARAGIGVTWLGWIEQGRAVRASPEALARLALALALTPAERAYLFELAARRDPDEPPNGPASQAPASLAAVVAALATPAYGLDRLWNACCWNAAAARLFPDWLGDGADRNLLRYVFTSASARALLPDWDDRARRLIAEFRPDHARALADPAMIALVEGLARESPAFAAAWAVQSVAPRTGGPRRFTHPIDGPLAYEQHSFLPAERPDHKLVLLIPAIADTG